MNTHKACYHNEYRAMRNRVIADTGEVNQEMVYLLTETSRNLLRALRPYVSPFAGMEEVVRSFPQSRRKRYTKALESLDAEPLVKRDSRIKAFVKSEKLQIQDKDGDPRMIQARTVRFNIVFAQYTKAVEHALYSLRDPDLMMISQVPLIAKGRNLAQRATDLRRLWEIVDNPISMSLDLSRWDMHVTTEMFLGPIHQGYQVMEPSPFFKSLLKLQLNNKAMTDHGIRYTNPAGVTSGDMTTAVGNCTAVIAILMLYRRLLCFAAKNYESITSNQRSCLITKLCNYLGFVQELGQLSQSQRAKLTPRRLLFYDDGDDHQMITEKWLYPVIRNTVERYWGELGHVLKVEGFTTKFHNILFCQHKPTKVGNSWVMSPDPYKVIATSTVVNKNSKSHPAEYLQTVWAARAILHEGTPVLHKFFNNQVRKGRIMGLSEFKHKASGLYYQMERRVKKPWMSQDAIEDAVSTELKKAWKRKHQLEITPEQRLMYQDQWGMSVEEQLMLENLVLPTIPSTTPMEMLTKTRKGLMHWIS